MITIVTLEGILRMSPAIVKAYGIVIGGGATLIGAALFERHFASRSAVIIAERIAAIVKVALPIAVIIALIIFALNNPLM
ncbi:hypothetical protein AB990_09180 [Alkalihalobacillus pseudalcaliphilus]|nr:hypothetical protein AB990_09180 [Alkalihalobacillus pseudalcaliphilus]